MRLLGIAKVDIGTITLQTNLDVGEKDFDAILRLYLRERLRLNRLVWRLIKALESGKSLNLEEMANLLSEWCPYISATRNRHGEFMHVYLLIGWIQQTLAHLIAERAHLYSILLGKNFVKENYD